MCGVVGYYSKKHHGSDLILNMLGKIVHRGPDSHGIWQSKDCAITFGHARLAIVDLTMAGHQPMSCDANRYTITFNGEIYNHHDLRKELGNNYSWKGSSDTETLLKCIAVWGVDKTIKKLVGMFAFILWDDLDKNLYLVRDRIGEKPLYYGSANDSFIFGSELKALKIHPDFNDDTNWDAVNDYLHNNYINAPKTFYKNIKQLLPGHYLKISQEQLALGIIPSPDRYWSINYGSNIKIIEDTKINYEKAVINLERLLLDSVSKQSIADVKVGAFLSGGVDSTTIVALLKKTGQDVTTFSIGMPDSRYDESGHAQAVAKALGTKHFSHIITPGEALDIVDKVPYIWDEPFGDSSQIPTYLVSKFAKAHVTVALSGDGGDELFMGYQQYPLLKKIWATRKLSLLPINKTSKLLSQLNSAKIDTFLRRINNLSFAWHCKTPGLLNEFWMDKYRGDSFPHKINPTLINDREAVFQDGITDITFNDLNHYLCNDILAKVDRASMAVSLETRAPFLDHRLVEFAFSLPTSFKMNHFEQKKILRAVLFKYIDKSLVDRPKQGFSLPMRQWLKKELKNWAWDRLQSLPSDKFDKNIIEKIWHEHQTDMRDNSERIWGLSNLSNYLVRK
ncbi:asparagine synthase (glutamine-hydrolyzing) [Leclercia adecarboxylata]|nr:asparagine synthase (glutamine-hydrolyzing) [Leclercia adecarboxylata]MBD1403459.1 asparagine synthase (glutamine-hydrolyzing) [Leclercia adecarboxylata]MDC6652796.1 asparagine synthase (glutamine-hydrolyzing) [Leclercia adecarboxylata]MDC6663467.1 asparagine synthase (glutamine-hydrolyzing) [Leclercia adecarboxylata]MDC6670210.1 asparagine synthase (glutamine-hydrolyzing) [Leclercia adecarboxylata]MDC6680422.1 asparagine synthase (glutamine-hydrolyzing) [Leclercia adecarboxylata]